MIPLLQTQGQQTNFGPKYWAAKEKYDKILQGHSVLCSSGTTALQIACQVTFGRAKKIAVPEFTHVATLAAVVASQNYPVICQCDPETGMLICPPVDGAVVVSPFGAAFNEHDYHNLGIPLVFDLCGAFPMILSTKYPRVYSTHATKNISTREGGIAVFQDPYLAGVARCLTNFSIREDRSPFTIFGGNHKMDEHRCGMLLDYDMKHIARKIEKKRNALEQYSKVATPLPGLIEGYPSLCVLKVDNPDALIAEGGRNDIIFKKYYYPLLSDVDFREKPRTACVTPNEELRKYVAFPSDVTNCQIAEVCELVKRVNNEKLSNI